MKRSVQIAVVMVLLFSPFTIHLTPLHAGTNFQIFYDFGSVGTACSNERTNRVTTTLELFYADPWGSTFAFVDFDYNINPIDPRNTPFMAYMEIARCLNFWQKTKAKDLSVQVEYNGGLGVYKAGEGDIRGYGINHAALVGLNYCLYTKDFKNIFNLELLYKYILGSENGIHNSVPLQFTFVWGCDDFCTAPGLRFSGFIDVWGQKFGDKQSFVILSEPQLWYNVGRWFKCPNLHIGTEIEFSYNFNSGTPGTGFMCNPCLGIKWCFD